MNTAWISELTTRKLVILSLVVGFVVTASQGVSVSGWLYEWLRDIEMIRLGVIFNLIRNTILVALVAFAVLYAIRAAMTGTDENPNADN